jgi:hypothetical protein
MRDVAQDVFGPAKSGTPSHSFDCNAEQIGRTLRPMVEPGATTMNRRTLMTALALLPTMAVVPALAEDEQANISIRLTAEQVGTLLYGNTIKGTWSGTSYVQFFDTSGVTIYNAEGAPSDRGRWRINAFTGKYESEWERTGWTPYTIVMTNDGFAWINRNRLEPFVVFEGRQLD